MKISYTSCYITQTDFLFKNYKTNMSKGKRPQPNLEPKTESDPQDRHMSILIQKI